MRIDLPLAVQTGQTTSGWQVAAVAGAAPRLPVGEVGVVGAAGSLSLIGRLLHVRVVSRRWCVHLGHALIEGEGEGSPAGLDVQPDAAGGEGDGEEDPAADP